MKRKGNNLTYETNTFSHKKFKSGQKSRISKISIAVIGAIFTCFIMVFGVSYVNFSSNNKNNEFITATENKEVDNNDSSVKSENTPSFDSNSVQYGSNLITNSLPDTIWANQESQTNSLGKIKPAMDFKNSENSDNNEDTQTLNEANSDSKEDAKPADKRNPFQIIQNSINGENGQLWTVHFDSCGGSEVEDITDAQFGKDIDWPADPTKTGFDFAGWYTSSTYETEWDFDNFIIDGTYGDQQSQTLTLYAKWEVQMLEITASVNDDNLGFVEIKDNTPFRKSRLTVPYGTTYTIDPSTHAVSFSKDGVEYGTISLITLSSPPKEVTEEIKSLTVSSGGGGFSKWDTPNSEIIQDSTDFKAILSEGGCSYKYYPIFYGDNGIKGVKFYNASKEEVDVTDMKSVDSLGVEYYKAEEKAAFRAVRSVNPSSNCSICYNSVYGSDNSGASYPLCKTPDVNSDWYKANVINGDTVEPLFNDPSDPSPWYLKIWDVVFIDIWQAYNKDKTPSGFGSDKGIFLSNMLPASWEAWGYNCSGVCWASLDPKSDTTKSCVLISRVFGDGEPPARLVWKPMQAEIANKDKINFYPVFKQGDENVKKYCFAVKNDDCYYDNANFFGTLNTTMKELSALFSLYSKCESPTVYYAKIEPDAEPLKCYAPKNMKWEDIFDLTTTGKASSYSKNFKETWQLDSTGRDNGIKTALIESEGFGSGWDISTPNSASRPSINGVFYDEFYNDYINGAIYWRYDVIPIDSNKALGSYRLDTSSYVFTEDDDSWSWIADPISNPKAVIFARAFD